MADSNDLRVVGLEVLVWEDVGSSFSSFVLLCYYLAWSEERVEGIEFYPESIDPFLCSHLVYSDASEAADMSLWKEDDSYQRFNDLKKKNKNLKTLMGYGGWAFDNSRFTDMAEQQSTRTDFINAAIDFLRSHGFDGLDLDWRFPAFEDSPASDKGLFTLLVKICAFLKDASLQNIYDQMVPYAVKGNEWLGYDDQKSFKTKAQWVKDNKFGGAMLWALDLDDYDGTHCKQGVYPLTNTLKSVLGI
ncbi:hypothetical protein chiPu_0007940 [Chiloscyllium punctatum]|uniref:GH18 domain-containing protein n=1 Tax=Chiloscyllium punctatum TaxID=137246 RepID=A0A401SGG5_CHIPU|nr:hypothetical protein [Chiloscyllium punctatum]